MIFSSTRLDTYTHSNEKLHFMLQQVEAIQKLSKSCTAMVQTLVQLIGYTNLELSIVSIYYMPCFNEVGRYSFALGIFSWTSSYT